MSMEITFAPFKKCFMLYSLYTSIYFKDPSIKLPPSLFLIVPNPQKNSYLSKEIAENMFKDKPRILIEKPNIVEQFYVKLVQFINNRNDIC